MARVFNANSATNKTINAIDRKREQERYHMLAMVSKNAEELSTRLVQRLLDEHILETSSDRAMREIFMDVMQRLLDLEEFDIQFKTAPLRGVVNDPNFISLYLTQYIIEDLVEHPKVQDVFGDDLTIYNVVDSIMSKTRPA